MNKKLFYAMSRRRVSCPQVTQQLWDAIKTIRYQRQVPDLDRIARYMSRIHNVSQEEVTKQLNYCVRDGLILLTSRVGIKGAKTGIVQESYKLPHQDQVVKDSHDWYCFECHRAGDVISCNTCHRVFHLACISKDELPETDVKHKFICNVCKMCDAKEELDIKKSQLNRLLVFTCSKLKSKLPVPLMERQVPCSTTYISDRTVSVRRPSAEVLNNLKWMLDEKETWRQDYLIYRHMDLQTMEAKADTGKYEHLEEFKADAQTIVHNVVIFHGVHSNVADRARLMLRDCLHDIQEIRQCKDCYRVSNEKINKHWFCKPCRPPHLLVYAKQKGFPYWPAKVIKVHAENYDVRFFGGIHQKAVIDKTYTRPISVNIHTLQVKRTSSWNKACEELKRHQNLLEKMRVATQDFTCPPPDSSSESEAESVQEEEEADEAAKERERLDESDEEDDEELNVVHTNKKIKPVEKEKVVTPPSSPVAKRKPGRSSLSKKRGRPRKYPKTDDEDDEEDDELDIIGDEYDFVDDSKDYKKTGQEKFTSSPESPLAKGTLSHPSKSKKRGRPPLNKNKSPETLTPKGSTAFKALPPRLPRGRGRPPGVKNKRTVEKEKQLILQQDVDHEQEEQRRRLDHEEMDRRYSEEKEKISTTSVPNVLEKKEEEEMVSSSCQEPQVKSIAIQTRPVEPKKVPETSSKDIAKARSEIEEEKNQEIERLKTEHEKEIAELEEKHKAAIADIKKKQWCFNCEQEAIYHCCWNTAYCSIDCQQLHWQKEHKRVCRRKR
uniref:MYND-type domain-containing protein n=1 Tax=Clastoptera arizonana TaxID=38151 RepID=A0A1B6CUA8_9HEMI